MNWFRNILRTPIWALGKEPNNSVSTNVVKSQWRNNMWVMSPQGIGIIFKLGPQCEVHLVDPNGLTIGVSLLPVDQLRQAKWDEIPESRRSVDRERGYQLGYF